jgi:hypothetical protein
MMHVARRYADRADVYRRVSWNALVELSALNLPDSARQAFERRILDGESVKLKEIARVRVPGKIGAQRSPGPARIA